MPENKRPVTAEDLYRLVIVEEPRISPDGRYVAWVRQQAREFSNDYRRDIWLSSRDGAACLRLTRSGADSSPRWSPDGRSLAFVSTRSGSAQLYLLPVAAPGGEARQLTDMPRGVSQPVWSPDGRCIAFLAPCNEGERLREDQGEREADAADELAARHARERDAQCEELSHDPRVIRHIPYREGTTFRDGRHAQIYVLEVGDEDDAGCKARRLTNLATDYSSPAWSADGAHLLCIRSAHPGRPEPRRWTSLYRIDVEDGAEQRLTGDEFNCADAAPAPVGDQVAFLLKPTSRRPERLFRLALVSYRGGEVQVLTEVFDRQVDEGSLRWCQDGRSIVFSAARDGTRVLWRLRPGGEPEALFDGTLEVLDYDLASDGAVACAVSTPQDPSVLQWLDAGGASLRNLCRPNAGLLEEIHVQTAREQRYSADDGTALQGWLMLPPGQEEGMQHPLIVHIHGGPQMMYSPANPPLWLEWQLHAANGYAVFFCNPRGSDGYGEAFRMALHNAWGEVAQSDIMAGVDHVIAGGNIDAKRLAVTGGSYGGYMTAWIVGHSDRFRAAVAQRGVYNLLSFFGVTDIPLFLSDQFDGTATQDPRLLWRHSPLAHADDINTPLLIIASEYDYRVPISESEQLFAYIHLRGGTVEFVRYPREGHEHTRSGEPRHRIDGPATRARLVRSLLQERPMTLAPSTCVVTGGAGFIGSHLSERLLRDGHSLRIVDNFLTGSPQNLAHLRDNRRLTIHELDIADAQGLVRVFDGADFVLHQAALPSVPRSVASPEETWQHCATGTLNVLHAARVAGVRRLVNASSSSVYGDAPTDSKHEDLPARPLSPYAAAKLAGEALCQAWGRSYGLETVSLRYFNVYGPRQDPLSDYAAVVPLFISLMLEGQRPSITGDGGETRGFTYVDDVVEGNLLALTAPCAAGQAINIGSDTSTSIRQLVEVLNELLGTQLPPRFVPPRPGDIRHSRADISRAQDILGYNPTVDLKTGLKRTLAWFRDRAG